MPFPILRNALILTGGGARAAYQVGALRAIADITEYEQSPFHIISGFSAGAINGSWLASRTESFKQVTESMWEEWRNMRSERIYRTDFSSLSAIALRWLKDRSLGGMQKKHQITYLLDTEPLLHFLRTRIDFAAVNHNIQNGRLYALSITAANYHTGHSTTFFSGHPEIKEWKKLNRISVRTQFRPEHVMASAAIPIFFPPVQVGSAFYGDGMIRLNAPLSAPIHLGANRLLAIGIRGPSSTSSEKNQFTGTISIAEIAGTILNGLFFDSLDADLARMQRINRTLSVMTEAELDRQPDHLRYIPLLNLRPSQEIEDAPDNDLSHVPATLRYFLKGIGLTNQKGLDLLSYLSFEPKYLKALLELGYEDTLQRKDEVLDFFHHPCHLKPPRLEGLP
jgi:NTE family protein